ncbi:uncharacterized protein BO66DRAFT_390958 [Aspergillus aculeatinus CBS 121060]|uniref:Uncharacterized protein n=1 Tax=Aspergillus aculeatinus CBS 121060 TaxID=1448322 RepID=A0ACD1HD54_9EURO|nr:hypothetical protein BO66DRAFT_390958 [Aspergillus aculeatinus CBS 121060]RAH71400.1 hypothetical protein BO66DRAFT_390958 [Aspergillus aculeatinus CBS 121060]
MGLWAPPQILYSVCLDQECYYDSGVKKARDQAWNYDQQHAAETLEVEAKGGNTYRVTGNGRESILKLIRFVKSS